MGGKGSTIPPYIIVTILQPSIREISVSKDTRFEGIPSESYSLVRGAEIFQMIKDELHQTPIISP